MEFWEGTGELVVVFVEGFRYEASFTKLANLSLKLKLGFELELVF